MSKEQMISVIEGQGVLPLFYHDDIEVCIGVIDALYKAGIKAVEFTNRGAYALPNFTKLSSLVSQRWQGLQLGAGTILNVSDAENFIDAGAAFIVCPGTIPAVAQVVHQKGLLWIPGCMTATEVIIAKDWGATLVKIFPGSLVGPSYISALKDIFLDMRFMPTGGVEVTENNISAWFKSGVSAVGLGSKVISKEALANKQYDTVETLVREALEMVKKVRGEL